MESRTRIHRVSNRVTSRPVLRQRLRSCRNQARIPIFFCSVKRREPVDRRGAGGGVIIRRNAEQQPPPNG